MQSARNILLFAMCVLLNSCCTPQIDSEDLFRLHAGFGAEGINKSIKTPFSRDTHVGLKLSGEEVILVLRESENLSVDTAKRIARETRDRMDGLILGLQDRYEAGPGAPWGGFPEVNPAIELPEAWKEGYGFGWWLGELQLRNR